MAWKHKAVSTSPLSVRIAFWMLCLTWILLGIGLLISTFHPFVDGVTFKEMPGPVQAFEIADKENFTGGYPNPRFASWGMLSCAVVPLTLLGLLVGFYALATSKLILRPMWHPWSDFQKALLIVLGHIVTLGFIFIVFLISQFQFIPPPGSS